TNERMRPGQRWGLANLVPLEAIEDLLQRRVDALVIHAVDAPYGDNGRNQHDGRQQSQRPKRHHYGGNGERTEPEHDAAGEDPPFTPRPNIGGQRDEAESRLELCDLAGDFIRIGQGVSPTSFSNGTLDTGERARFRLPRRPIGVAALDLQ